MTSIMSSLGHRCVLRLSLLVIGMVAGCSTAQHRPIRPADFDGPIRVACVGDSITYGYGIADRERNSYPAQLQSLLGDRWEVRNFGVNGATALKRGTRPYSQLSAYRDATSFEPDVVILKLGTNDTNAKSWPLYKEEFFADYYDIVRSFRELGTKPRVYICIPVPLFRDRKKEYDTDKILTEEVIPKIKEIGRKERLPIVDFYTAFESKSDLFPDGVHPDATGVRNMAEIMFGQLTGQSVAQPK
jgi:acyl-CoA thioesterase-1